MRTLRHLSLIAFKKTKQNKSCLPKTLRDDLSNIRSCCFITNPIIKQQREDAIMTAISNGHISCFDYFLQFGSNDIMKDETYKRRLTNAAIKHRQILCLGMLVDKYSCPVEEYSISECVNGGGYKILELLMMKGVNIPLDALHASIISNDKKCFNLILKSRIHIRACTIENAVGTCHKNTITFIEKLLDRAPNYLYFIICDWKLMSLIDKYGLNKHIRVFEILFDHVSEPISDSIIKRAMKNPDEKLYELITNKILNNSNRYRSFKLSYWDLLDLNKTNNLKVLLDYKNFIDSDTIHSVAFEALRCSYTNCLKTLIEIDDSLERRMPPEAMNYLILKQKLDYLKSDPTRGPNKSDFKPPMIFLAIEDNKLNLLEAIFKNIITNVYENFFDKYFIFTEVINIIIYLNKIPYVFLNNKLQIIFKKYYNQYYNQIQYKYNPTKMANWALGAPPEGYDCDAFKINKK